MTAPFRRSSPVPGVRLVTERMPYVRSVSIGLWVGTGSRDEAEGVAGSSHLLEHLLFKGTERRSARDIAEGFDAVGGELNAYSAKEHTCFYARVLDSDVAMAADVLTDMFSGALLRDEDLEAERKVVLEEIHMTEDMPDDKVHDLFAATAWPGHPLGRPVLGTVHSVGSIDRDRLVAFYREGYVPGRLVVAAAGNIEHDALAEHLASGLRTEESGPGGRDASAPQRVERSAVYEHRTTEQVHLVWGCEGVGRADPDRYALSVLNALFGGGMSSRLFQEVRERRGLAYQIFSYQHMYAESGLFAVYAGTQEATAGEVLGIVRDEARAVASGAATADEVERAKGHVKGGLVLSMDDPGGRMSRIGKAELSHGEILTVDELLERVDAVTPADVARLASRLFSEGRFMLSCIGPVASGAFDGALETL